MIFALLQKLGWVTVTAVPILLTTKNSRNIPSEMNIPPSDNGQIGSIFQI